MGGGVIENSFIKIGLKDEKYTANIMVKMNKISCQLTIFNLHD